MKINFMSAAGGIHNAEDDPSGEVIEIKEGSIGVLYISKWLPFKIAFDETHSPNKLMLEQLKSEGRRRVKIGVTVMDFPGHELIEAIINSNESVI